MNNSSNSCLIFRSNWIEINSALEDTVIHNQVRTYDKAIKFIETTAFV